MGGSVPFFHGIPLSQWLFQYSNGVTWIWGRIRHVFASTFLTLEIDLGFPKIGPSNHPRTIESSDLGYHDLGNPHRSCPSFCPWRRGSHVPRAGGQGEGGGKAKNGYDLKHQLTGIDPSLSPSHFCWAHC